MKTVVISLSEIGLSPGRTQTSRKAATAAAYMQAPPQAAACDRGHLRCEQDEAMASPDRPTGP